jgi:serine/threonine protein kinase
MSLEQAAGKELDGRSDLFAVGVMLWELLTGRRLFDGSTEEAFSQIWFGTIQRPSALRADVPSDLEAIAMRLLERELSDRYANADQVIEDLAACADASKNGRRDLSRLLAERFPNAIEMRSLSPQIQSPSQATSSAVTAHERARSRRYEPTWSGADAGWSSGRDRREEHH